ncbi:MAG: MFS transporter [archaeon]|nr:MFS transporter [archaeon]
MKSTSERQSQPGIGVMVALLTCSMLILMGGAAVAPGLPRISQHFADSGDLVSFVITLPHLSVALVGFLMGIVSDRFGKVRTLLMSLAIFIITGVGSYFLDDIVSILVLRFLLGFGLAGIVCTVTSLIGSYYSGPQRARMLGLQSAAMGVGILILEVLGGTLADISWNAPFLVYLIAVPFALLVIIFIREPSAEVEERIEADGSKGDVRMLVTAYIGIFVGMIVVFTVPTQMPAYMENVLGVSAAMMGLFLGFHGLGNATFSLLHRRFSQRLSPLQLLIGAFLLLTLALSLPKALGDAVPVGILTLIISGFAIGLMVPSAVGCVMNASTPANRGKMMGIYAVFLNMGQFGVSLMVLPVLSFTNKQYPDMFVIFSAIALVMALALTVVMLMNRRRSAC